MTNSMPGMANGSLHVAELAARAGVTPATIRHYARSGLLHAHRDPENGYRQFVATDVERVRFVRCAQDLGLRLNNIRSIMDAAEHGEAPCDSVRALVQRRMEEISCEIAALRRTRQRIVHAMEVWDASPHCENRNARFCRLIEMLL